MKPELNPTSADKRLIQFVTDCGGICSRYERLTEWLFNRYRWDANNRYKGDAIIKLFQNKYHTVHEVQLFDLNDRTKICSWYVKSLYAYRFYKGFGLKAVKNYLHIK